MNLLREQSKIMNDKLKPKKIIKIMYNCLILFAAILAIIRWISAFNNEIVVINAEINSHISNFALSLIFYLGVGFTWILQKMTFKKIIILGLFIIIANIICETVMGFMNTTDIIDAIYGIVGTLLGFCYLLLVNKYGLENIHDES
ncbi:hypothetical protein CLOHYLEM_05171 [[Clostridium] hylemonae DSM 15053]|uniref:VanZ-like domain-containing protein n=2 Tax=Bacillota TaxID=1239 RepID=C0BZD1_9FIRM|nr:hypothetical protein CLOHYLEM_05171 [[Clostridium] hylemonae DSM 15053]QEK18546.1 hypothetical protein LAJLEIBI_02564 [[Clostridium] hylemonae DSM 15053]